MLAHSCGSQAFLVPPSSSMAKIKRTRRYIRSTSPTRKAQLRDYAVKRVAFLERHPWCAVLPRRRANQVHHMRGRHGALLLDERYWLAVSQAGHNWITAHPKQARARGFLCELGKWGVS